MGQKICQMAICQMALGIFQPMAENGDMANFIRKVRKAQDVTLEQLAERTGLSVSFLSRMESSKRGTKLEHLLNIGRALNVDVTDLSDEINPAELPSQQQATNGNRAPTGNIWEGAAHTRIGRVKVNGPVKASAWQEADREIPEEDAVYVPTVSQYPDEWQRAYTVEGPSLNKIAREGDVLVCLSLSDSGADFTDGDLVIAERRRFHGQMFERTAKRVKATLHGFELWPESDHPDFQEPLPVGDLGEDDHIDVAAKVLWILRKP